VYCPLKKPITSILIRACVFLHPLILGLLKIKSHQNKSIGVPPVEKGGKHPPSHGPFYGALNRPPYVSCILNLGEGGILLTRTPDPDTDAPPPTPTTGKQTAGSRTPQSTLPRVGPPLKSLVGRRELIHERREAVDHMGGGAPT